MSLTAGTPLDVLTDRLGKAGWGDLGTPTLRGLARVLEALGSTLNRRSGAGYTTAPQLAEKTCYTERWVRRCLTLLEQLDLIEWHRGGVQGGKPVPSWIRVSKSVLADLVHIARRKQGERLSDERRATRSRIDDLRTSYTQRPGRRQKKRRPHGGKPHAELATGLLLNREVPRAESAPSAPATGMKSTNDDAPASADTAQSAMARIRADLAARRGRHDRLKTHLEGTSR
jgi:hypothetical protein